MSDTGEKGMSDQPAAKEKKSGKDFWEKVEILSRPIQATVTALAIALIGYFGQHTLTTMNSQEQNARLFTELLSKREDAESSLRKDMFKEILDGFFDSNDTGKAGLSKRILKLELLAQNFGDSLSLGPLFSELSRDIDRYYKNAGAEQRFAAAPQKKRLRSLARQVASTQMASIISRGESFTIKLKQSDFQSSPKIVDSDDWQYSWPYDLGLLEGETAKINILELDGKKYHVTMHFRSVDLNEHSILAGLNITALGEDASTGQIEMKFTLDHFNFPLIDNTRLPNSHRFAVVLEKFNKTEIHIKGILFPGMYASQRDKPFLSEAIDQLKKQRENEDDDNYNF